MKVIVRIPRSVYELGEIYAVTEYDELNWVTVDGHIYLLKSDCEPIREDAVIGTDSEAERLAEINDAGYAAFNLAMINAGLQSDNLSNQLLLDECKAQLQYLNKRFGPFQNTTKLIARL